MWYSENMIQYIGLVLESIYTFVLSFKLKTLFEKQLTHCFYTITLKESWIKHEGWSNSALTEWVPYKLIFNKRFQLLVDCFKCWEIHYFLGQPPSILTMQIAKSKSVVSVRGRMGFQP